MSHTYLVAFAPALLAELSRLKNGNRNEVQRYHNALSAIEKVKSDPKHKEFSKDLPGGYKAVDVLEQYRLFFRLERHPKTAGEVIFFVWINNETSIHRSGKSSDCYQVFKRLLESGEIEQYQPPEDADEKFLLHGNWGEETLHAVCKRILSRESLIATGFLALSKMSGNEYQIKYISVSQQDKGLAAALLNALCKQVDARRIVLTFDWYPEIGDKEKNRYLLEKFGFTLEEEVEDLELWVRKPRG